MSNEEFIKRSHHIVSVEDFDLPINYREPIITDYKIIQYDERIFTIMKKSNIGQLSNIIKSPGFKLATFIISIAMIIIYAFSGGIFNTGEPVLSISMF